MPNTLLDIGDPNGNKLMLLILRRTLTSLETDGPVRDYHLPGQGCETGVGRQEKATNSAFGIRESFRDENFS